MSLLNRWITEGGVPREEGSNKIFPQKYGEKNWPLVTVITPTFNQGEFLEATIRSVLLQGYPNLEYMVIDGGSTDGSVDIIRRYADPITYWISEEDRGQSHAINKGLVRSKGTILGWLNSDDIYMPGTIFRAVEMFSQHDEIDVVYGHIDRIDQKGRIVPTPILPKDKVTFDKHTALMESVVNQPGSFWRKRIMDKVGYLNDSLHYGMDYEYWTRMLLAGAVFWRVNETVAMFRLSASSKTVGQTARMARESISIINSFSSQADLASRLELTPRVLHHQANKGRGAASLLAFYGCLKEKKWSEACRWFIRAHFYDPLAAFRSKWLSLALARLVRKM